MHLVITNNSDHRLIANASTKIIGQLDAQLPDIEPGDTKDFFWRNHGGNATGVSGVVHYCVGDTSLILNVMISIDANFNVRKAWSNARLCHYHESFRNLRNGKNGCLPPTEGGEHRIVDGCDFELSNSPKLELRISYEFVSYREYAFTPFSDVLQCKISNNSPHILLAIGSTKSTVLLDTPMPDILPSKDKTMTWNDTSNIAKNNGGVLHYHIGDTGMILNIMVTIAANRRSVANSWCNTRVCNWIESYKNLYKGIGGCRIPERGGNRHLPVEGCDFNIQCPSCLLLSVSYNYNDNAALPISRSLSSSIVDAYYEHIKYRVCWICVIVNKSQTVLFANNCYEKSGRLLTRMTDINPNEKSLLVYRGKMGLCGASGVILYNIGSTGTVLNIMAAVHFKKDVALCNVYIGTSDEPFMHLYDGSGNCCKPAFAGTRTRHSSCDFILSKRKRAIFVVAFNGTDLSEEQYFTRYRGRHQPDLIVRHNSVPLLVQADALNEPGQFSAQNSRKIVSYSGQYNDVRMPTTNRSDAMRQSGRVNCMLRTNQQQISRYPEGIIANVMPTTNQPGRQGQAEMVGFVHGLSQEAGITAERLNLISGTNQPENSERERSNSMPNIIECGQLNQSIDSTRITKRSKTVNQPDEGRRLGQTETFTAIPMLRRNSHSKIAEFGGATESERNDLRSTINPHADVRHASSTGSVSMNNRPCQSSRSKVARHFEVLNRTERTNTLRRSDEHELLNQYERNEPLSSNNELEGLNQQRRNNMLLAANTRGPGTHDRNDFIPNANAIQRPGQRDKVNTQCRYSPNASLSRPYQSERLRRYSQTKQNEDMAFIFREMPSNSMQNMPIYTFPQRVVRNNHYPLIYKFHRPFL